MFIIRKEFSFSAGHFLEGLPKEHPCSRQHGHNYVVIVELRSKELDKKGFVLDYHELKPIKDFIDNVLDHRFLNDFLPFNPTAENIAEHLFDLFRSSFPQLYAIEVCETPKTMARYEPSNNNNKRVP